MWQRKLRRFLLLPIGIIGVPVIMLVVPLNYTPDTSVPFPYVPPPTKGSYIGIPTTYIFHSNLLGPSDYSFVYEVDPDIYIGESLIFKDVLITPGLIVTRKIQTYIPGEGLAAWETETFLMAGNLQFVPQDPSDLRELKVGDVVDITGFCSFRSKEWPNVIVFKNCQFMPAGVAPLPLPGGLVPISFTY